MNKIKTLLIYYLITIIVASIYVPWQIERHNTFRTITEFKGYGFILSQPGRFYTIDFKIIALEFIVITASFLIIYLYLSKEKVTSSHNSTTPVHHESSSTFNFIPNMPDITSGVEIQVFKNKDYFFFYKKNVVSIGETQLKDDLPLKFPLVMFVIELKSRKPSLMISIESGFTKDSYLCFFEKNGAHTNLGEISTETSIEDFKNIALDLAAKQLKINISEIVPAN